MVPGTAGLGDDVQCQQIIVSTTAEARTAGASSLRPQLPGSHSKYSRASPASALGPGVLRGFMCAGNDEERW
jgi:hypothetical protein